MAYHGQTLARFCFAQGMTVKAESF
ncbi:hypothetical protein CO2235_U1010086 [Cupriavidus oxalaticus]|uniref:Uncharacterized protein n=1 Tax=Cupriavidus oxalaticus TaxID=96344 RepID=A0A375FMW7_9BURK|nr:hypothetical protein CO2235_U1010086 [Cupriavidus oxalaticus]